MTTYESINNMNKINFFPDLTNNIISEQTAKNINKNQEIIFLI